MTSFGSFFLFWGRFPDFGDEAKIHFVAFSSSRARCPVSSHSQAGKLARPKLMLWYAGFQIHTPQASRAHRLYSLVHLAEKAGGD